MIFLIDNQLPPALADYLRASGEQAEHVADRSLERATDRTIWEYAETNGCAVVTKDEDFVHLSIAEPDGPPVVWIRLGNCRTDKLLAAFTRLLPQIRRELAAGAKLIEVV